MGHIKTFIFGVILGIANVIPGVSGGTMAVILNIYDRIILSFSKGKIRENLLFLGLLALGTASGVLIFSSGITYLIQNYNMATNFCFIGLVIGSMPMVLKKARFERIKTKNLIPFFIAFFFMLGLAIIKLMPGTEQGIFSPEQLDYSAFALWLFLAAMVSTIGMILPGISGSFIMLLLGAYFLTMEAIAKMDFAVLIPVAAGVLVGGYFGIRTVGYLLKKHPQALYLGILGLMVGSISLIFPGFTWGPQGGVSIVMLMLGTAVSFLFGRKSR